ncbi:MAG: aminotransferase class III-fold pyridoxal phosphate-dependent enzyme [Granulosicoccus sp.]|nr:aminotransferase class III-fold pyridoxal phosphate-dependent enzyme [Granulosicoccus sp.]
MQELDSIDRQYTLHPFTNMAAHENDGAFIIDKGDGIHVWDDQGNQLIEGMSGLWCTALGFSEQRLIDAATRQFAQLPYSHMFSHRSTPPAIELSQKLVQMAPDGIARAFFVNSGSEAVDAAVKIAWYYNNALGRPHKKTIIARQRAYHGVTVAAGSLTGLAYAHDGFDLPAIPVMHVETPHAYRHAHSGETEQQYATRLAESLEKQIIAAGADTFAAFIAEPVMGAGGVLIPPETYFEKIQAVLKRHDILFIADEVICGFGRTGATWGSQRFNIRPDIMTCAKQLSSAYLPIGAVLVNEDVSKVISNYSGTLGTFGTGTTYGGHPVCAAVALETLNIYETDGIFEKVRSQSAHFAERVQALQNHPLVGQARSVGLIGAIELVADKSTRKQFDAADKMAVKVAAAAREHKLIVRPTPGDSIAFCPPLIINDTQIDQMFDAVANALNDVQASLTHD